MKRFLTPVFLLTLLAFVLGGCNNPAKQIAVGLKIAVSRIERASDGTVTVAWHVENPNVVSYIISRATNKVYLNGTYLGQTSVEEPIGIPAGSQAGASSKLMGGDAASAGALAAAIASGSGSYRIESKVVFRIYDDNVQQSELSNTGTVSVIAK